MPLSRGIGSGPVKFLLIPERRFDKRPVPFDEIDAELAKLYSAVESCRSELRQLSKSGQGGHTSGSSAIFGVHALILETSGIPERVAIKVRERRINVEWALEEVEEEYRKGFAGVDDPNFREKIAEVHDVITRIRTNLVSEDGPVLDKFRNSVVAARRIPTSLQYKLCDIGPAAILIEHAGWTSHVSIIAREFGVPMVTGLGNPFEMFREGDRVVVDGNAATVRLTADSDSCERPVENTVVSVKAPRSGWLHASAENKIDLYANADSVESVQKAVLSGFNGIGLFRTDRLVRNGGMPLEEEQRRIYAEVLDAAAGLAVNFRTFDFGIEAVGGNEVTSNPALGLRSLRMCLSRPEIFRAQIRALARAAGDRHLRILLPMVADIADVRLAKKMIGDAIGRAADGSPESPPISIGAMIELPSAVLTIESLVREVSFLCIGTNDLVQYLLGADRDNDLVAAWYQSLNPAVLIALKNIFKAASEAGIEVIICGEMASSPFYLPVLIGLGFRSFSISPASFDGVEALCSAIDHRECEVLAQECLSKDTAAGVESYLRSQYELRWPDKFPHNILISSE